MPEPEMRARQLAHIRDTVFRAAEKSRFYGNLFRDVPEIKCRDDLERLPFTFPEDIRRDPYDFLCVRPGEVERIVSIPTSGTTEPSKRIFFTADDMERTVEFFRRGMGVFTEKGDTVAVFMPGSTVGSVGDLLSRGLLRLGAKPVLFGVPECGEDAARKILESGANVAVGVPMDMYRTSISSLAEKIKEAGTLKSILISADAVPDRMPELIEENLGCKVFEHYGMTETCFGGGVFCAERVGYHLRDDEMYFETVDISTGKPCAPGEYGEVVVTTFSAEAMPLIRYRTGDIARFRAKKCPCGYEMPVLERVRCRNSDVITLPDGENLPATEIENMILARLLPEDLGITWNEREQTLSLGICGRRSDGDLRELRDKLENAGAKLLVFHTEKTETDKRAMQKRTVKRI